MIEVCPALATVCYIGRRNSIPLYNSSRKKNQSQRPDLTIQCSPFPFTAEVYSTLVTWGSKGGMASTPTLSRYPSQSIRTLWLFVQFRLPRMPAYTLVWYARIAHKLASNYLPLANPQNQIQSAHPTLLILLVAKLIRLVDTMQMARSDCHP